ncbi:PUA domain-containing protein [Halobium salinum]|uniref:PUA domain-containing protein n=1 Tax=Halobium salinum TaxID=1364940 RepID=A0ABD5PD74_9EURY|nr:PUA domain-containing protein [Halobium salinum]
MSDNAELPDLRTVADYQFGAGAGVALFPADEDVRISRSTSGRPRQIHAEGAPVTGAEQADDRVVSYSTDGRFTLGLAGGRRLAAALDAPAGRVVVGDESEPFVREGKNVFAKFVRAVDPDVRPGDEVAVVRGGAASDEGREESVLGVGRAELSASGMLDFETGMAVKTRQGAGDD